jgi:hypothetical protein
LPHRRVRVSSPAKIGSSPLVSIGKYRTKVSLIEWPGPPAAKLKTQGEKRQMSELLAPFGAPQAIADEIAEPTADSTAVHTPVLITEQEVRFATAAAVPLQPTKAGRRWTGVIGAVRAMFVSSTDQPRERRHYPPRNDFLESSRMSREMYRL